MAQDDKKKILETEELDNTIDLTLHSLLTNPTGKHTAFMASRARIIEDLEIRYAKLLNKHKSLSFKVFKKTKDYIFVFKVPSETHDNFMYDVVITFSPSKTEYDKDRTLNRYSLHLFSNSPAFTYTYTYVLNKSNIIPKIAKTKCSPIALKEPPKVKNPVESYGFEKSCYFACLYIKQAGLTNKFDLDANLFLFNQGKVLSKISSQEDKLKEYNLVKANGKKTKVSNVKKAKPSAKRTLTNNASKKKKIK